MNVIAVVDFMNEIVGLFVVGLIMFSVEHLMVV